MPKIKEDYLILFCVLFVLIVILARYKIFNDNVLEGWTMYHSSGSSGGGGGGGGGCTIC